jgi:type IV secretory pathway VirB4 component
MPTTNTTQTFVPIKDIRGNVVILKNGQLCMVLLASSINFALKSTDEQEAILLQFQNFLNTLDFSLQIFVKSRKLNVEPYLQQLSKLDKQQDNELMRTQLQEYIQFIRTFTHSVDVMSKEFFVVVPYSPSPIGVVTNISGMFASNSRTTQFSKSKSAGVDSEDQRFEEYRFQLEQRAALVAEGLARTGVRTIPLDKDDLVDLYYHVYNPDDLTGSPLPFANK